VSRPRRTEAGDGEAYIPKAVFDKQGVNARDIVGPDKRQKTSGSATFAAKGSWVTRLGSTSFEMIPIAIANGTTNSTWSVGSRPSHGPGPKAPASTVAATRSVQAAPAPAPSHCDRAMVDAAHNR
jgi:hypothetical protein